MSGDALLTATEAASLLPIGSPHVVYAWRSAGKLQPQGRRGRSPLYRWADLVRVERDTRMSGYSHRRAA